MMDSIPENETPLPWQVDAEEDSDIGVAAADGLWICALTTEYGEEPYAHGTIENARRIVQAVNERPAHIAALHALYNLWFQSTLHRSQFISETYLEEAADALSRAGIDLTTGIVAAGEGHRG